MRVSAGLKGFSGKIMRNARARKHISVLSEPPPIFVQASAEPNLFGLCRAQPKISKQIFVQASAEPNDCVKPNEQNRVYSNFAMASNRTFKNLFGLCRAQPKISKQIFVGK